MPELPEVEAIKTQLGKYLTGHKILSVEVRNKKIFQGDISKIINGKIIGTRRFGKVSVIDLNNNYSILTHVKLTGQYIYRGPNLVNPKSLSAKVTGGIPGPHTHVIFNLDKNGKLYYNDVRRFGWIRTVKSSEIEKESFISKLGTDALKISLEEFEDILSKTSRNIKVTLMDQEKIGGVGNIYANDALWLAKINPKTPAKKINGDEVKVLFDAVKSVLAEGIKYGGASELAFVTPDGTEGNYQKHTLAYDHEGEPCERPTCRQAGVKIQKIFLGGRGTFFCPVCQK